MKKSLLLLLLFALLGFAAGFFTGKAIYNRPLVESVTRDTVVMYDTIPQYFPKPVEVERVRTEYQWLPLAKITHDTVGFTQFVHDSVLVEVPITSKHYHSENYDAYVSGYQPNLDSINVYQRTEYITKTVTLSKPPNKLSLSVNAGLDYGIKSQFFQPYASGELTLNNHKRVQLGIEGGIIRNEVTNKYNPFAGVKAKIKIL